jgi:hypothetical protein
MPGWRMPHQGLSLARETKKATKTQRLRRAAFVAFNSRS